MGKQSSEIAWCYRFELLLSGNLNMTLFAKTSKERESWVNHLMAIIYQEHVLKILEPSYLPVHQQPVEQTAFVAFTN